MISTGQWLSLPKIAAGVVENSWDQIVLRIDDCIVNP